MINKGIGGNLYKENGKNSAEGINQNEKKEETVLSDRTALGGECEKNNIHRKEVYVEGVVDVNTEKEKEKNRRKRVKDGEKKERC